MHQQQRGVFALSRTLRKKNEELIDIVLRNIIIPFKDSTQFLGITLDSRLNWEEHINKLRAKAKIALKTKNYITQLLQED